MQVKDEGLWQDLVRELKSSDEGIMFHDFVTVWCTNAEQVMAQDGQEADPADSLRLTLPAVEEALGHKNILILGQCLVVMCMHWAYGEKASQGFTELEMRLVQDITAAKIAQLQEQAESVSAGNNTGQ